MNLIWTPESWEDYNYWQQHDKKIVKKINELIKSIQRTPFEGIGKPEPLKLNRCAWSRRINHEHRLVYEIANILINDRSQRVLVIYSCRYHYE